MVAAHRKKLIEVALPLAAINAASARGKSIRHGHPSTLHLWWPRRPLAACRAVLFAQLVDDPSSVPEEFPDEAAQEKERRRLFGIMDRQRRGLSPALGAVFDEQTGPLALRPRDSAPLARAFRCQLAQRIWFFQGVARLLATDTTCFVARVARAGSGIQSVCWKRPPVTAFSEFRRACPVSRCEQSR